MIDRTKRIARLAAIALLAALPAEAATVRLAAREDHDPRGYLVLDSSDSRCTFAFVDIAIGGEALAFVGAGSDPDDDGGAYLALEEPFELYGAAVAGLVVSTNGYLAAASSLGLDDGGDFSNDARLPAIPDNAPAIPARLLAFHAELAGGSAASAHFAVCPRPSDALPGEGCTIVQWTGFTSPDAIDPFTLQAVLYHHSFEVAFLIRPGADGLRGGTIGIQDGEAVSAAQYAAPDRELATDIAVCLFDPRYPPGGPVADLEMINTDAVDVVDAGQDMVYAVSVINRGPSPVAGARVIDLVPSTLVDCTWTCQASPGSNCTEAGSSSIDDTVAIAPAGWVDYTLSCNAAQSETSIVHTASVSGPAGVTDPDPTNDASTDVDRVVTRARLSCPSPGDRVWPAPAGDADSVRCAAPDTQRASGRRR
jgi:uncharacterized repeat protein (TIGR01451 family)